MYWNRRVACWTSRVITVVHTLLTLLTHSFQETHQLNRHCARNNCWTESIWASTRPWSHPARQITTPVTFITILWTNRCWRASDLYTAGPVWRGLSAASCSAGRRWVGCTSGSGRCEGLWPSTERSCPARWDGRCTTGSWSAALCQGSNLTGSSAARRGGDKDQETSQVVNVWMCFYRLRRTTEGYIFLLNHFQPWNQIFPQTQNIRLEVFGGFERSEMIVRENWLSSVCWSHLV